MAYERLPLSDNLSVNEEGRLFFAGADTRTLAEKYGTPLYLMDEDRIRANIRLYKDAFRDLWPGEAEVLYASKACSFLEICRIAESEGISLDAVSPGELLTAKKAGFDLGRAYFQGNNKTDEDIACAVEWGVGTFVTDNPEELSALEKEAARRGIRQKILLRLTPGVDCHTYEAVNTGKVDSKFGVAIETGQAASFVREALASAHLELLGFHCHVGSQVFDEDVFERTARIMLGFIASVREETGYTARVLDLGGGYGVRYVDRDPAIDVRKKIGDVSETIRETCRELSLPLPRLLMEPGRSIVADAGLTLYRTGSVKRIPGYKNYLSVDGGMGDNPRFALYGARYTVYPAEKMREERDMICDLVGRFCESGDEIQRDIRMPRSMERGDLVAVATTGAYNYSMASLYNRVPRPPVVMIRNGEDRLVVRRETPEDLLALDL